MATYSFQDIIFTFTHPSIPPITLNGLGVGDITCNRADDASQIERSSDGRRMTSKIDARNGNISMQIQQTSDLHHALIQYYNLIEADVTGLLWAQAVILIDGIVSLDHIVCTGVSPQKLPDRGWAAQGANITWNFLAETISPIA